MQDNLMRLATSYVERVKAVNDSELGTRLENIQTALAEKLKEESAPFEFTVMHRHRVSPFALNSSPCSGVLPKDAPILIFRTGVWNSWGNMYESFKVEPIR